MPANEKVPRMRGLKSSRSERPGGRACFRASRVKSQTQLLLGFDHAPPPRVHLDGLDHYPGQPVGRRA